MDAETQTQAQTQAPRLKTNLDTNFLKLIAILCMVVDHVGTVFFPGYPAFRWVGRLAFPIFCYCRRWASCTPTTLGAIWGGCGTASSQMLWLGAEKGFEFP